MYSFAIIQSFSYKHAASGTVLICLPPGYVALGRAIKLASGSGSQYSNLLEMYFADADYLPCYWARKQTSAAAWWEQVHHDPYSVNGHVSFKKHLCCLWSGQPTHDVGHKKEREIH